MSEELDFYNGEDSGREKEREVILKMVRGLAKTAHNPAAADAFAALAGMIERGKHLGDRDEHG